MQKYTLNTYTGFSIFTDSLVKMSDTQHEVPPPYNAPRATDTTTVTNVVNVKKNTHNCDYSIDDVSPVHNFTHHLVDQIDKTRPLLELYGKFTPEQKQEIRVGLDTAETKYIAIRNTHLDFICFFDHQTKQPVDIYESAHASLAMSNTRLANISLARIMLDRWDSNAAYVWSDADNVIARTRFLKTAKGK